MMNINKRNILYYEDRYNKRYKDKGKEDEKEIKSLLKKQRYLKSEDLIKIGEWKSKRPKKHYKSKENDKLTVSEITGFAFTTRSERAQIKSLMALKGVSWPVASTILHFAFPNKYPIMDFRVLWSLWGMKPPIHYGFKLWKMYCKKVRGIAKKYHISIRRVEKSLWQYSKERQG